VDFNNSTDIKERGESTKGGVISSGSRKKKHKSEIFEGGRGKVYLYM